MGKILFVALMVAIVITTLMFGDWQEGTFFMTVLILGVILFIGNDIDDLHKK